MRVGAARAELTARGARPAVADEDAVYQFVTMVARGYQGQPGLEHRHHRAGELGQAKTAGPRLPNWSAMIARWISLVPSQMRSTRSSR